MIPAHNDCDAAPNSPVSSLSDTASDDCAQSPSMKRFPCKFDGCEKDFSTSGQLSRHNRIHKGIKKFHCDVAGCPRTFFRADNREQHSKSHHRRLNLKLLREREAIACTVLTSGVSHAALESSSSRSPISTLSFDSPPRSPPALATRNVNSLSNFGAYPMCVLQRQGFRSTFVIPSSSSSSSSYSGNVRKTSIQFLCE
ncbi:hypothetical protein BJ741DRAFT_599575 [Chytriomyces cf. hyalinus JEL632]|nr:hypothetical protein BJ741DRAFT_599575 [Chytriomyces cf. hyalinus JEL632]